MMDWIHLRFVFTLTGELFGIHFRRINIKLSEASILWYPIHFDGKPSKMEFHQTFDRWANRVVQNVIYFPYSR